MFQFFNGRELPVLLIVGLAVAALHILRLHGVIDVLLFIEADRIVVHVLGLREVLTGPVGKEVHTRVNYLLHDRHVAVVAVVRHRNHRSRGQAPSKTARADLGVETIEELRDDRRVSEHVRILGHTLCEQTPLLKQFFLVLVCMLD